MRLSCPPDWLIYAAVVLGLAAAALADRERADAPPAPPPVSGLDAALTSGPTLMGDSVRSLPGAGRSPGAGTAFSVSDAGVWITARQVVAGCRRAAVLVAPGRGVLAKVFIDPASDLAVLVTEGGTAPLPLALDGQPAEGQRAYQPGYPRGGPGETTSRLLGRDSLRPWSRDAPRQSVLVWAEVGRTEGLRGGLTGMAGAPVLDRMGRVIGVTLAEAPRRGRIYSSPPQAIRAILTRSGQAPSGFAQGLTLTTDNYGRAADDLRRNLRIVQAACVG